MRTMVGRKSTVIMMQGDINLKEALEMNFHYKKVNTLMYINFSLNSIRHSVRLTRKKKLERL